jgi:hypothetical protein
MVLLSPVELLEIVADHIGIIGLVGDEGVCARSGNSQRIVALAVRRFAGREVEGDRPASGITETMNFTGEPTPRPVHRALTVAAKVRMPALARRLGR